jgi:DnaJ-class molecular chaperone
MLVKEICPRCQGNGFIKVKESIENPIDIVQQCTMCNSKGELMMDKERLENIYKNHVVNEHAKRTEWMKLKTEHVKKLEIEIEKLMKQKAVLQDQLDKYIDKEIERR